MSKVLARLVAVIALLALVAVPSAVANATGTGLWPSDYQATTGLDCAGSSPRDANNFCYVENDGGVELGVRFTTDATVYVVGVRIYRVDAGTVTGTLWNASGASLATGQFPAYAGAHGWQDLIFAAPVEIAPGTTYTASYHTASGDYAYEFQYPFPTTVAPITADAGTNGVYQYCNPGPCFPNTHSGANYWVTPLWVKSLVAQIEIDIKPGSDPNAVNCQHPQGVIPVAILTTDDFDATTVDHTTVELAGAGETHLDNRSGEPRRHERDVDGDGDIDLVFHFRFGDTSLDCDATEATLSGQTFAGEAIEGSDSLAMIGG